MGIVCIDTEMVDFELSLYMDHYSLLSGIYIIMKKYITIFEMEEYLSEGTFHKNRMFLA